MQFKKKWKLVLIKGLDFTYLVFVGPQCGPLIILVNNFENVSKNIYFMIEAFLRTNKLFLSIIKTGVFAR